MTQEEQGRGLVWLFTEKKTKTTFEVKTRVEDPSEGFGFGSDNIIKSESDPRANQLALTVRKTQK